VTAAFYARAALLTSWSSTRRSTPNHPALFAAVPQPATGVEQLVINGKLVIENGRLNPVLPGGAIRRRAG
jgi:hypothetical protein